MLVGRTRAESFPLEEIEALTSKDLRPIIELEPHILLLGTGETQVFPHPRTFIPLIDARIGYEIMDTAAACRTYNVLLNEGREVLALLFP